MLVIGPISIWFICPETVVTHPSNNHLTRPSNPWAFGHESNTLPPPSDTVLCVSDMWPCRTSASGSNRCQTADDWFRSVATTSNTHTQPASCRCAGVRREKPIAQQLRSVTCHMGRRSSRVSDATARICRGTERRSNHVDQQHSPENPTCMCAVLTSS